MSIQKIYPEDIEIFTLETNPSWNYSSGSLGISGSLNVFQRRSKVEKEVYPLSLYSESRFVDKNLQSFLEEAKRKALLGSSNTNEMTNYMSAVNAQQVSVRKQQTVEILRFTPGFGLSQNIFRKQTVLNTLFPYYRHICPSMHFAFTNYNSLNFISSSTFPDNSALLYPQTVALSGNLITSAQYAVSGAFTFDFWIKPNATTDRDGLEYKAGTILHLSSCFAISLVSGSSRNPNGCPDKFRILLQLSSSADLNPSMINLSSLPSMTFLSDDNSIKKDFWNHVTIRWGSNSYNLGSGSFVVNSETKGNFIIDKSKIDYYAAPGSDGPSILVVGNYYQGTNVGFNAQSRFFASDTATREGLLEILGTTGIDAPNEYIFNHPLNAELHEIKIYDKYLVNQEIENLGLNGPNDLEHIVFYVPPFFTEESPTRQQVGSNGGIFLTPYQTKTGTTKTPFSAEMAFEIGGHYINLENFTRDFATGRYPRLLNLSASTIASSISIPQTANAILYSSSSVRRRNLTILPCDNGEFLPNYKLLVGLSQSYFKNDLDNSDLSLVSLRNLYPTESLFRNLQSNGTSSILSDLMGPNPDDPTTFTNTIKHVPTILQRTRDNTSNQIVFFDISTLFYDQQLDPGTITITDSQISGSEKISVTLKDDGYGNLYRSNTSGSQATWNSVGNVFYNEGLIVIKHPSLFFFGENQFSISFKGRHNLHVMSIDCKAEPGLITSSSNTSYSSTFKATSNENEYDQKYVLISDILLHDENLNVVTRTKLAQQFMKKSGDGVLFKVKLDY